MTPLASYVGDGGVTPYTALQTIKLPRAVDGVFLQFNAAASPGATLPNPTYTMALILNPQRGPTGFMVSPLMGYPQPTSKDWIDQYATYAFLQGDTLYVRYHFNIQGATYDVFALPDNAPKKGLLGLGLLP